MNSSYHSDSSLLDSLEETAEVLLLSVRDVLGKLLCDFDAGEGIECKLGNSADLVTAVDRGLEDRIVALLAELRPGDGVVGEEGHQRDSSTGVVWVIDPVDGTASLVSGAGSSAVSIAATSAGRSLVGLVLDIGSGEVYRATLGRGATLDHRTISVRPVAELSNAVVATDFGADRAGRRDQADLLGRVSAEVRATRNIGSTVLHLAWVAAGRLDAMYQTTTKWWDLAAGGLCVTEAGGTLSDLHGGAVRPDSMVAASPGIHEALLEVLRAKEA